jgi:hypothetical protein
MAKPEEGIVVKFFFHKDFDSKAIHKELTAVLGSTAYSLTEIIEWRTRFEDSEFLYRNESRAGNPPHILGKAVSDFLEGFLSRLQE